MDKLKNIVGHKSTDSPTDSHAASGTTAPGEHHPIYDEFTNKGSHGVGQPAQSSTTEGGIASGHSATAPGTTATGSALPHSTTTAPGTSTTASSTAAPGTTSTVGSTPHSSTTSPTSTLQPDSAHLRPQNASDAVSNTSIKSGVLGFPQESHDRHAALESNSPAQQSLGGNQTLGVGNPSTTAGETKHDSHLGRDAALGAGAGGIAAHELGHRSDTSTRPTTDTTHERSLEQPTHAHDSKRTFPLAGGSTADHPSHTTSDRLTSEKAASSNPSAPIKDKSPSFLPAQHRETTGADVAGVSTNRPNETFYARQPGRELGPASTETTHDGHGREALAGAAAGATAASAAHHHHDQKQVNPESTTGPATTTSGTRHPDALAAATTGHHKETSPVEPTTKSHHHPEAVAAATSTGHTRSEEKALASHPKDTRETHGEEGHSKGFLGSLVGKFKKDKDTDPAVHDTAETTTSGHHHPGALAAATAGHNRSEPTRDATTGTQPTTTGHHNPGALAAATAGHNRSEPTRDATTGTHATTTGTGHTGQSHNPEALAAATAAAAKHRPEGGRFESHSHGGLGHNYLGDPCGPDSKPSTANDPASSLLYTSGPHKTDAGNAFDPHVPGGFPNDTPRDERSQPSLAQGTGTAAHAPTGQHELRHAGTLGEPQTRSSESHHLGRDGAVAGGLGAAGLGAYEASKHHGTDPSATTGQSLAGRETSPYSHTAVDPRVHGTSTATTGQSTHAPVTGTHSERGLGASPAASGSHHGLGSTTAAPGTQHGLGSTAAAPGTQHSTQPTTAGEGQHHYGRDAALAAAGATTTAGLYENQRRNEAPSGPASSTIGPHKSNVANVLDPRVQPDPALQKHHHAAPTVEDPAPSTVGPHKSDLANIVDPRVLPDPQKQKAAPKDESHLGRDAALAGGAGGSSVGAYEAAKAYDGHRSTHPDPAFASQKYDPTAPGAHDPTGASGTHTGEPARTGEHHYGRDAAVAGGLGGAGAAAYAASRDHKETPSTGASSHYPAQTGPTAADSYHAISSPHAVSSPHAISSPVAQQPLNPSAGQHVSPEAHTSGHHHGREAAAAGGLGAAGAGAYAAGRDHGSTHQPTTHALNPPTQSGSQPLGSSATSQYPTQTGAHAHGFQDPSRHSTGNQAVGQDSKPGHHYGRDAAVVGGLGAAGAGTYAATHHGHDTQAPTSQQPLAGTAHQQPGLSQSSQPLAGTAHQQPLGQHAQQPTTIARQDPRDTHHTRDAAAGTGRARALSKHELDIQQEQDRLHEKQLKEDQKSQQAQEKLHAKYVKHEQKVEEKQRRQSIAAEEKHRRQSIAAEKKEREAAAGEGKRRGSILGFLQRDKTDKEDQDATAESSRRHSKEYAAAGAATTAAAHEHGREDHDVAEEGEGKRKASIFGFLHRDKAHKEDKHATTGDLSPRHSKEYAAAGATTTAAAYEHDHDGQHERNRLHKDPPTGHPAREALEHPAGTAAGAGAASHQPHQHVGTDGPIGSAHPTTYSTSGSPNTATRDHRVIEPHTGLPVNVGKYGTETTGGTDGNPALAAHHHQQPTSTATTAHGATTDTGRAADWDNVKKNDTLY